MIFLLEKSIQKWEEKTAELERDNFHSEIALVEEFLTDLRDQLETEKRIQKCSDQPFEPTA